MLLSFYRLNSAPTFLLKHFPVVLIFPSRAVISCLAYFTPQYPFFLFRFRGLLGSRSHSTPKSSFPFLISSLSSLISPLGFLVLLVLYHFYVASTSSESSVCLTAGTSLKLSFKQDFDR